MDMLPGHLLRKQIKETGLCSHISQTKYEPSAGSTPIQIE